MAGELKHKDVGVVLSQAEWEATDGHILGGQTADDIIVASSATQLSRLAVAASRILGKKVAGNLGALTAAEILTILNVEAGATADQTGVEIVTLLEALVGAAQLSHTKISDVGVSDHHSKYLDSEAVTAAKTVKLDDFTAPDDNTDLDFGTTRHGLTPKGTDVGNFLKDDGAWATPAGGISFTELAGGEGRIVTDASTWEDWDISGIVPAGTKSVLVEIFQATVGGTVVGARKNGSSLDRTASTPASTYRTLLTECDVNRVIELFASLNNSNVTFSILGYWG